MVTFLVYIGCVGVIMFAAYWVIRLGVRHGVTDAIQRVPDAPVQRAVPQRPVASDRVGSVPPPRETS